MAVVPYLPLVSAVMLTHSQYLFDRILCFLSIYCVSQCFSRFIKFSFRQSCSED